MQLYFFNYSENPFFNEKSIPVLLRLESELIEYKLTKKEKIDSEINIKKYKERIVNEASIIEKYLKTPARIYYKDESVSPAGSHKPNTAIAQAWYNKKFGIKRLTTETGAGQWGSALAYACNLIGLKRTFCILRYRH